MHHFLDPDMQQKRNIIAFFFFFLLFSLFVLTFAELTDVHSNEVCDCYPHEAGWSDSDQHGKFVIENGYNPNCTECHDTDLTGGFTGKSCFSCHPGLHILDTNWASSSNPTHPDYAISHDPDTYCANCHGSDFNGGISGVSCHDCHELYPHTSHWMTQGMNSFHGNYVKDNDAILKFLCTECHKGDYSGGRSHQSCFNCHKAYPHQPNMSRPDVHGNKAQQSDIDIDTDCLVCHDESREPSCYDCHTEI